MPVNELVPVSHNFIRSASILNYFGGKSYTAPWIIGLMPPHDRYIEPFFGSGAVFFRKAPVVFEVLNDLDGELANFFRTLRDQSNDLIAQVMATPYSRTEFALALERDPDASPLEQARRLFVRQRAGFSGQATSPGNWGVSHNVNRGMPTQVSRYQGSIALMPGCAQRLARAMIECDDFGTVITRYVADAPPGAATLVYCDPPYVPASRTSDNDYAHEMTLADHERLLDLLIGLTVPVMLSGYPTDLYADRLAAWDVQKKEFAARSATSAKQRKGQPLPRRVECVWRNAPAMGRKLHQATFF